MTTKAKAAVTPPTDVTIPRSVLRQFVSLVEGLQSADEAYMNCQSTAFRSFARSAYTSVHLQTAYAQAKAALDE